MLVARELKDALKSGQISFSGRLRGDSFLLSLGNVLQLFSGSVRVVDPFDMRSVHEAYEEPRIDWREYELPPARAILVSTAEQVALSSAYIGFLTTLSHVARLGIAAHMSSSVVSPHFCGNICLEISNYAPFAVRLRQDMPIAKMLVASLSSAAEQPEARTGTLLYGNADLRSRYPEEFRHGQ